ncbi:hypothetical protein JCM11251_006042 [Rhodosporidiobolus azoricus]
MSSQKGGKTDLIARVRYQNPLPPPPFPPRLIHIPTTPQRYATYDFLTPLQSERQLPMILDAELGMPLEYGKPGEGSGCDGEYWLGNRERIAPRNSTPQTLADEDLFLLDDPTPPASTKDVDSTGTGAPGTPHRGNVTDVSKKVDVSWLRRTEYLSSEAAAAKPVMGNGTPKRAILEAFDPNDRDGRARNISSTFDAAHVPLSSLKHPTKPGVHALEAFDLLPDSDLWANEYDLVRFGENPGEGASNELPRLGTDPRLPRAIFRDLTEELGDELARVSFYLPADDATAVAYTQKRMAGEDTAEGEAFDFRWTRDYQVAASRPLNQEYIFTFDAGEGEDVPAAEREARPATTKGRTKGAYYVPVSNYTQLRKRRAKRGEDIRAFPEDKEEQFWDGMTVSLHHPTAILPAEAQDSWMAYKGEVENPPADLAAGGAADAAVIGEGGVVA